MRISTFYDEIKFVGLSKFTVKYAKCHANFKCLPAINLATKVESFFPDNNDKCKSNSSIFIDSSIFC